MNLSNELLTFLRRFCSFLIKSLKVISCFVYQLFWFGFVLWDRVTCSSNSLRSQDRLSTPDPFSSTSNCWGYRHVPPHTPATSCPSFGMTIFYLSYQRYIKDQASETNKTPHYMTPCSDFYWGHFPHKSSALQGWEGGQRKQRGKTQCRRKDILGPLGKTRQINLVYQLPARTSIHRDPQHPVRTSIHGDALSPKFLLVSSIWQTMQSTHWMEEFPCWFLTHSPCVVRRLWLARLGYRADSGDVTCTDTPCTLAKL